MPDHSHHPSSPYLAMLLSLSLVALISACGKLSGPLLPMNENSTPDPAATQAERSGADKENMSTEASLYLNDALDILEQNSVMGDRVDWESLRRDAHAHAGNAQTMADTYPAIRFAIEQLDDHHSFFLDPIEAKAFWQGIMKNLGFIAAYPSGAVMFVAVGGPADKSGIRVGDVLETVDGNPIQQDQRRPVWVKINQEVQTQLTLRHPGQEQAVALTLSPEEVVIEEMPKGIMLLNKVGYITLPQLIGTTPVTENYANVAQQIINNLDEQGACGWIVDLRQNRGGNMWPMLAGIGPILGEGKLGSFIYRNESEEIWAYRQGQSLINDEVEASVSPFYALNNPTPAVAVLTSGMTGSSGEAVVIAFRGRPNTQSFGEPTAGVPTSNTPFDMKDGAKIILTTAWEADRTGNIYQGRIPPDELVEIDWNKIGEENDPVIKAASNWLLNEMSCNP